ncbi:hypothetical protein CYMTET_18148 [Cymbomonas tetramitiformis]|uniref:Uncharacterized protein n=1 Tax=Cymbomonas tetramitiformis TaxID=36881 RepID=A0AAE0L6F8_9CHLO|nr:hypothetical protein CYMTET_18148 [Cymbomonas tetramitiformis]
MHRYHPNTADTFGESLGNDIGLLSEVLKARKAKVLPTYFNKESAEDTAVYTGVAAPQHFGPPVDANSRPTTMSGCRSHKQTSTPWTGANSTNSFHMSSKTTGKVATPIATARPCPPAHRPGIM